MAYHYSANQYESPYKPKALCNWEIPKNYFQYKPQRTNLTSSLVNDRDHFLSDVTKTNRPLWDDYLGLWHMPTRIDPNPVKRIEDIGENERKIHEGLYELKKKELIEDEMRANVIPVEKLPEKDQQFNPEIMKPDEIIVSNPPMIDTIYNFNLAKRLHRENLEHDPLPDTISDAILKKLQAKDAEFEADGATGIGWKGYPGFGPTRCTKLKIYRPKIAPNDKKRSSSATSFDKKWRFLRRRKVTPIELAICWDLYPENCNDEPKPPKHIDGSNGSQAPAVFTLVKSQTDKQTDAGHCERIVERIANQLETDREFVLERPKTAAPTQRPPFEKYEEKNRFFERFKFNKRSKSACNLNSKSSKTNFNKNTPNLNCCHCSHCYCSNPASFYQEKCRNKRLCMACELKNIDLNNCCNKNEYKMAFKAGIPQKSNSVSYQIRFSYKAPKQRNPFSPRRYKIHSLAPPFSLQKDKSLEYPEHWRLATVYQQSYKPIQYRKRPLIETVFK